VPAECRCGQPCSFALRQSGGTAGADNEAMFNTIGSMAMQGASSRFSGRFSGRFSRRFSTVLVGAIMMALVACAPTPKREGTGEYVDDSFITTKVKGALFEDPDLKSREIDVETFKGVVQLSGFVGSKEEKQKAVEVASKVSGVKSVKDSMVLK
jgi:osmotically-inducible protein OsmY